MVQSSGDPGRSPSGMSSSVEKSLSEAILEKVAGMIRDISRERWIREVERDEDGDRAMRLRNFLGRWGQAECAEKKYITPTSAHPLGCLHLLLLILSFLS